MTEGIEIRTIPDLVKRVKEEWDRKSQEAEARKKELEENMRGAIRKAKELKGKLEKAESVVQKMEFEYSELESKLLKEKRKAAEKDTPLEKDVKEGKISLKEFQKKGKFEAEIQKAVIEKTQEELSQSLEAIRKKRLDIMNLELELIRTQHRVRQLMLQPGVILKEVLKNLKEFADRELGLFYADYASTREAVQQQEHKLNLTRGKSLTPGYRWDRMKVKEARKIAFDPILPRELVPSLLQQLSRFDDSDQVIVDFTLRPLEVHVSRFGVYIPQTGKIKIME